VIAYAPRMMDGVGHDLAPLQIGAPTGLSPATVIGVLPGLLSPEAITILVKARKPFSFDRSPSHGLAGLACAGRHVIAVISHLGTAVSPDIIIKIMLAKSAKWLTFRSG
jgi:TctA family transporter